MLNPDKSAAADLRRLDAAHHLHPFTDFKALNAEGSRVVTRAEGVWLWDADGNRLLDGMAGLWCSQIGHGRREIADAVHRQMLELDFYNTFFKSTHPPAAALSAKLAEITPAGLNHVFFTGSGSEANDTALRLARRYWALMGKPDKQTVISRAYAYHGSTVAAAAVGGMAHMHAQNIAMPGVHHILPPYWFEFGGGMDPDTFGRHAARALERAIDDLGADTIAAFIAEPIQGAGGVIVPPDSYWPEIRRICARHDILLIVDEVICGFGRTGEWFGSDYYGLSPDLMSIAKGLSSGYLPIGGVMVSDRVADVVIEKGGEFFHGFTYSGHPACCAAALANLRIFEDENVVGRARDEAAPYLREQWLALADHPLVGEARMVGLLGALELVPDKAEPAKRFAPAGRAGLIARDISVANGLVMRAVRDALVISPPLVISREEIDMLIDLVARTLDDTLAELKRQGLA